MNPKTRRILSTIAASALLFALAGCAGNGASNEPPSSQDSTNQNMQTDTTTPDTNTSDTNQPDQNTNNTPTAPTVDRSTLPWNEDMPAEFPLEDIPLPPNGTFNYAEIVDGGAWNVMISDVPRADHEAWLKTMESQFNKYDGGLSDMTFIGKAPSGNSYIIAAMIFDENGDKLIMTYRIS